MIVPIIIPTSIFMRKHNFVLPKFLKKFKKIPPAKMASPTWWIDQLGLIGRLVSSILSPPMWAKGSCLDNFSLYLLFL